MLTMEGMEFNGYGARIRVQSAMGRKFCVIQVFVSSSSVNASAICGGNSGPAALLGDNIERISNPRSDPVLVIQSSRLGGSKLAGPGIVSRARSADESL